jgi:L-iditol 2-dehydrogenase
MRVAMYYRNDDVRVEEMPAPAIGPGELRVRIEASGICGSDVMEWYRIKKAPLVLGHEIGGQVVEVGEGVERFTVGDRVTATHHVPCNTCHSCLQGHHTLCDTLRSTKFAPGGFCEQVRIPALQADRGTLMLPDAVSYEQATFVEPLGCVVRGQRGAAIAPGQSVLVLGSGLAGLLHIALARAAGAGPIVATDVHPYRIEAARRFGADLALDARSEDVEARLKAINGGRRADRVIVSTAVPAVNEQAFRWVARGGTILFFALVTPGVDLTYPAFDLWNRGVSIVQSYAAAMRDLDEALRLIEHRRVPVAEMITHRLPLAETARGFGMVAGAGDSIKVVVEPQN